MYICIYKLIFHFHRQLLHLLMHTGDMRTVLSPKCHLNVLCIFERQKSAMRANGLLGAYCGRNVPMQHTECSSQVKPQKAALLHKNVFT